MTIEEITNKLKLKFYLALKKRNHGLSIFKKNEWSDKFFDETFNDVSFEKLISLSDKSVLERFYTIPFSSVQYINSDEHDQFILGGINDNNIRNYIEEVDSTLIVGDCLSNKNRNFKNLRDYIRGVNIKSKTLKKFASYYYLFDIDKDEFVQLFINKDITKHLSEGTTLTTSNTVYLIKKENKYYVVENGRHRVLFAKLFNMGTIKAVVFNAD